MKKIAIIILAGLVLTGCGNDDYAIEKHYYQIQKQAAKIFKNPEVAPQRELENSVNALADFAKEHTNKNLSLEAEFTIARLYIVKKEYEKARMYLSGMLKKYSSSEPICSEVLFLKGNSYEIQDKWNLANTEYQNIIQQYPLTLRGLSTPIYLAQHYKIKYEPENMMQAYRQAVGHYNLLIGAHPDSAELVHTLYQLVAQGYAELKDWQGVINTFEAMLRKYSDEKYKGKVGLDTILLNLAALYNNEIKDKAKAKEALERLIKEYPQSRLIKAATEMLKKVEK